MSYLQKIYFGSPGTGKSFRLLNKVLPKLGIDKDGPNCITTVFHPDYTYGDFIGKLLPLTVGDKVTYEFYPGFFLRSLAVAYKNLISLDMANLGRVQSVSIDDYDPIEIDDIEYEEPPVLRDEEDVFSYFPGPQEPIPSWMKEQFAPQNVALVY